MNEAIKEIYEGVIEGQSPVVQQKVKAALEAGIDPSLILNEGMIAAMAEVGKRFEDGDYFVPEMLISARAMQGGMALLKPHLAQAEVKSAGKVVIGTVKGDLHDIGKNLVSMMVEGNGYRVIDLGVDVGSPKFIAALKENPGAVVGLSALLTTTMANMEKITKDIKDAIPEAVVTIGGAPVNKEFCQKIGADFYSPDPQGVVDFMNNRVA